MDSYIHHTSGGTTYSGPDAVRLQQAITLRSAIKLYRACGVIPTRGMGIVNMLKLATSITGKPYKRTHAAQAEVDLHIWIETMKSALPIFQEDQQP
jgi:hypothetical protein